MRLETTFRLSLVASIGAALALAAVMARSLRGADAAREADDLASQLEDEIQARAVLREEYFQYGEARPRAQWAVRSLRIRELMGRAAQTLEPEEREILRGMHDANEQATRLFAEVGRLADEGAAGTRGRAEWEAFHQRAGDSLRLAGYELGSSARRLAQRASERFEATWRRTAFLVLALVGSALVIAIGNAALTNRLLQRRIARLQDGAQQIAEGHLEHRIAMAGDDELADLGRAFDAMSARVQEAHGELEGEVRQRQAAEEQLLAVNRELEAFSYSVSHDLRAPLRAVAGFSQAVLEDHGPRLDETGRQYLEMACAASREMGQLIDDLISLSRVTRSEMVLEEVDLSELARSVATELRRAEPDRVVEIEIAPGLAARGDPALLRIVLDNLLRNAWKFTSRRPSARIAVGKTRAREQEPFFVADDGAGFDMAYVDKVFQPFQRLHAASEFPGTGVGLATVRRIVRRHGGEVWIEGAVEKGATVCFTLRREPGA